MRPIDWDIVPFDGQMVLLTVPDLVDGVSLHIADFKDSYALAYIKTGNFLGLTRNGGIRFGKPPVEMVDGVWFLVEDPEMQQRYPDIDVSAANVELKLIP